MINLKVNGKQLSVDVHPDTPLLWVLRETLGLTGTKYGCGMALCGACTVHLNGDAIRSCVKRVSDAAGKEITTIEGLSSDLSHPLQKAWIEIDVPQCGYCQSGQLMSAAVLLAENSSPSAMVHSAPVAPSSRARLVAATAISSSSLMLRFRPRSSCRFSRWGCRRPQARSALPAFGGGLLISLYIPEWTLAGDANALPLTPKTFVPNAFVRIGNDEIVTVIVNKSEMGQGVYTSLPMLLAEELEADWTKIRYESAPVAAVYNHPTFGIQITGGSMSTASEWDRYRQMGAAARVMLIAAAAQNWKVDAATLRAENGYVINPANGQRASFGSLADVAATMTPPKNSTLTFWERRASRR